VVHVKTSRDQHEGHLDISLLGSLDQSSVAVLTLDVDICIEIQQQTHDILLAVVGCSDESTASVGIMYLRLRPSLEQHLDDIDVALLASLHQTRIAVVGLGDDSSGVYICKSIVNYLRHGNYICELLVIYLRVYIASVLDQICNNLFVPEVGGLDDGAAAVWVVTPGLSCDKSGEEVDREKLTWGGNPG
jgi:hypothetical protein